MFVTIELKAGSMHNSAVTKKDMDQNISALNRAIERTVSCSDDILLSDTKSILLAIKDKLP